MSDMKTGSLAIMGYIHTVDNPDSKCRSDDVVLHRYSILVEFDSNEDLLRAVADGKCAFVWRV